MNRRQLTVVPVICAFISFGVINLAAQGQSQQGSRQASSDKPLLSEQAFKNVQLLRGIPVDEFMQTMGFFSASTGFNCTECHTEESGGDWAKYADDAPLKQIARKMIVMVTTINQANFGGNREVTCWSCHRGGNRPQVIPRLSVQYSNVMDDEPDETAPGSGVPSANQILDKYLEALGGLQRISAVTTLTEKGTYEGYDTGQSPMPVEIYAKTPNSKATVIHTLTGDNSLIFDGSSGWVAAPQNMSPIPVVPLTGGELDGTSIEAKMLFPAQIKQFLTDWRVGNDATIEDKDFQVVQGRIKQGGLPVRLYFDKETNLLSRLVRYSQSPVGIVPKQIDYSDYRVVSGIKIPFKLVATWTDGQSTTLLNDAKINLPIEATRFGKPNSPIEPPKR